MLDQQGVSGSALPASSFLKSWKDIDAGQDDDEREEKLDAGRKNDPHLPLFQRLGGKVLW